MIHYRYKNARILFVGINPHFGSFDRGVPFSNNKMFWYLLSDAGILKEERNELRDDDDLRRIYNEKFNVVYGLGFVNIINRPTRDITELKKGEELPGRRRIARIIKTENPQWCVSSVESLMKNTSDRKISLLVGKNPSTNPGSSSCIFPCAAKRSLELAS